MKKRVLVVTKPDQVAEELMVLHLDPGNSLPKAEFATAHPVRLRKPREYGNEKSNAYRIGLKNYKKLFMHVMRPEYLITPEGTLHRSDSEDLEKIIMEMQGQDCQLSEFVCEEKKKGGEMAFEDPVDGNVALPEYEEVPEYVVDYIESLEKMRAYEDPGIMESIEDFQVKLWEFREDGLISDDVEAALYDRYCRKALNG